MALFGNKDKGIDARAAAARIGRGEAVLLDVRDHDEWRAGHAPHAIHIPLGELEQRLGELPRDKPVVAVCRSGGRSALAASSLRAAGLEVQNLDGGMKAWHEAGLPLEPAGGRVA